jgi:hypothetical protein
MITGYATSPGSWPTLEMQACLISISAAVPTFAINTLGVLELSNMNFMIMLAPPISVLFVRLRCGSVTCVMITIYFLIAVSSLLLQGIY